MFSDNFSGPLKHYLVNHQLRTFLQPKTARNLQIWQSAAKSRILIDSLAICITFLAKNKSPLYVAQNKNDDTIVANFETARFNNKRQNF